VAFDPVERLLYVAAESGPLSVFAEDDAGVQLVIRQDVGPNAHSVAVDQQTHHLYVPLANLGGRAVLRELLLPAPVGGDTN